MTVCSWAVLRLDRKEIRSNVEETTLKWGYFWGCGGVFNLLSSPHPPHGVYWRSSSSTPPGLTPPLCPPPVPHPLLPPPPQPMEIFVDDETKLTLHGLQQYYVKLKDNEKNRKLFDLLDVLEFNQVSCSRSSRGMSTSPTVAETWLSTL